MIALLLSFRPLARWIGLYQTCIYHEQNGSICFRPLARWIGLYRKSSKYRICKQEWFPSPREVDRFISEIWECDNCLITVSVPSRGG